MRGGAASGTVVEDSPLIVIPEVRVIGDGSKTLFGMDAQALYYKNACENSTPGMIIPPGAGDEATVEIACVFRIPFQNNIGCKRPDTVLPAHLFDSLNLVVNWGTLNNMFEGTYDREATLSNAYGLTPVVWETDEAPELKFVRLQGFIEDEITATRRNFPIDLEVGDRTYQAFMFKTLDADCRESDIINYVDLYAGAKDHFIQEIPFEQGQHFNKIDCSLESAAIADAPFAGILYLYMLEEGLLSTGFNTAGYKKARFDLDVTVGAGTTMIRLYYDCVVPFSSIFTK